VPLLEFTSETSIAVEDRLKSLEAFKASLTPEQKEQARKAGVMRFQRKGKPEHEPEKECKDGKHCGENFKQVQESDLLDYLKEGWEIAYKLSDGQVIVKSGSS
jgi:hypothetical protein